MIHDSSRFEPALRLAIEGRWPDAVRAVVQAVAAPEAEAAHGDEASEALAEVARMASEANDPAAADDALIAALLIRPHHAGRLHQRAVVRLALGDRGEARALLERALALDSGHVAARLELSMLETREGRLGHAVASLRGLDRVAGAAVRRVRPEAGGPVAEPAGVEDAIAQVRHELEAGRHDAAQRRVDRLLEEHPASAALHALRGEIEFDAGALDDAVASCSAALELDPGDIASRVLFAKALEGLGLRDQALEQIGHVLGQDARHEEAQALEARWSAGRMRRADRGKRASHRS